MKTEVLTCKDCGVEWEREVKSGGKPTRCGDCGAQAIRERNRIYREANREERNERRRAYYEANKDRENKRNRAYYEANRERRSNYYRAYCAANKEREAERRRAYYEANKDRENKRNRAYREANKERLVEWARAYRQANRERLTERNRAYREANREWYIETAAKHKAKRRAIMSEALVDDVKRSDLYVRDGGRCYLCSTPVANEPHAWHIEHLTPLSRGGLHAWDNLAVACPACNLSKNAKTVEEYLGIRTDDFIRPTQDQPIRFLVPLVSAA